MWLVNPRDKRILGRASPHATRSGGSPRDSPQSSGTACVHHIPGTHDRGARHSVAPRGFLAADCSTLVELPGAPFLDEPQGPTDLRLLVHHADPFGPAIEREFKPHGDDSVRAVVPQLLPELLPEGL